jgi:Family of unknown function (DUF5686)/CarboxypepD_reg-like domain
METTATLRMRMTIVWLLLISSFSLSAQKVTTVRGQVVDAKTKETMPYVNVQFEGTSIGVTSDIEGNFYIETKSPVSKLKVSYVGYQTQSLKLKQGESNNFTIKMEESSSELQEVVVKVGKYRNKGNPAVELIKKVIDNKDKNRKEGLKYYNYKKYEKVEFAMNNVTDKMRNNILFRKIKFVFDNADTNRANGKVSWPFFLRENISDVYYRKDPKALKEYVRGERITNLENILDNVGIGNYITNMYQDINFYNNAIDLLTVQFVSPLNPIAPTIYRFYIQDTSDIKGTPCAHMYFAPRNKTDLAFMGHMWVALDSTYAVRRIEVGIPKDINLNWVNEMQIAQEYDWVEAPPQYKEGKIDTSIQKRGLMLSKDVIFMDFGFTKGDSTRTMLGSKTTSYKDYTIEQPLADSLFKTKVTVIRDADALVKKEDFWVENRHDTLSRREKGIYKTVDSLNNYKPFKRFMKGVKFVFEGYTPIGGFDLGPANTFYSFNPIEGFRGRLGGRTNSKFSPHLMLEGYAAYGFKDEKWKGYAGLRYNFTNQKFFQFPLNQLRVWYQDEIRIPGQALQYVQEDNIFLSIKRGVNNKMLYTKTIGSEYSREYRNGFAASITAKNMVQAPAGVLLYDYENKGETLYRKDITSTEFGLFLRYAPNEKFYQGATYRTPILNKYPIFNLSYTKGVKGLLGSEYNYHSVNFKAEKIFYLAPFGYSDIIVEGGRTFGNVPYPLLTIHRANQTYAYQMESYNLMNFLEFVSDKYASINIYHNFGGVFLGRIPLLKKLKWREVITFKSLWGGLDNSSRPNSENGLLRFPVDENTKQPLTYTLEKKPYIEASVGIGNIFRVVRVDYVRRVNYLDHPNVVKWGIRTRVKLEY